MVLLAYYMWAVTALLYQHRISSRVLSMKKLGILRTEMIFTLPRCLRLRVMCPLHLQELDGLVASLALRRFKNTDWTLRVRKIRTQLDLAQVHCLLRLLETLLQLGHVEHIMHHSQTVWKLEAERERYSSLKNTERTNEPGSQLAFDPKAVSAPKWRHFEVCIVTNFELNSTVLLVIIGLLPRLCCLEVLSDHFDPVLSFLNGIWTEQLPFSCFGPIQRSPALPAIQDLERSCLQTCLKAVVVRKLSVRQAFFPLHAKGDHTCSQHVLKNLIHTLNLPTCLRVIRGTEHNCRTNRLLEGLPEHGGEQTAPV